MFSPTFCIAATLAYGDTADRLLKQIRDYLSRNLQVVDPATLNFSEDDKRHMSVQEELLERCFVQDTGVDRHGTPKVGVAKRRAEMKVILQFFAAPWTKGLLHPCPAGCCGKSPGPGPWYAN